MYIGHNEYKKIKNNIVKYSALCIHVELHMQDWNWMIISHEHKWVALHTLQLDWSHLTAEVTYYEFGSLALAKHPVIYLRGTRLEEIIFYWKAIAFYSYKTYVNEWFKRQIQVQQGKHLKIS